VTARGLALGGEAGLTKSPVEAGDQGACPSADPSSFVPSQDGSRSSAPFAGPQLDLEAALLFLPKRRAAANADTSTTSLPSGFYTPETLAAYLGVSLSTIYSWNSSGYGPPFVKLGNLVRYTYEDVELWLARQLELSRG
jgi:excisionase family DNA binding protein